MNLDGPSPASSEPRATDQPSDRAAFGIEVRLYDALGLVKQAADNLHDLQRWKEAIEPQALSLIQSVQQERARWQVERSALADEIRECRLTITATKTALRTALSDKAILLQRCHDAQAAASASEERACAAEALLAFIYRTFSIELGGPFGEGRIDRLPTSPAVPRVSPE